MTTSDPSVLWAVVLASAGSYLLCALLVKYLLDQRAARTGGSPDAGEASAPTPHRALPAAPEVAPGTAGSSARGRHRKGSPWT